ncbi:MAG: type II secretion system F family protein [Candidatus Gracilibacteria bacterium]|nr:type II secretion system F family protein [Candidatus Gracilibacteria bacterium]
MPTNTNADIIIMDIKEGIQEKKEESILTYMLGIVFKKGSISLRQKVVFFRIMATMVNANLTVLKSLSALKKQEKDKNMIKFYEFMIGKIQGGSPMHDALEQYYGCFADAEVSIIEAGEKTGKLNQALIQIADQTEKVDSITRKIKGAMTYPILLIVGMVICVTVLMVKVIPTLTSFFGDPETLPTATQYILKTSHFFQNNWLTLAIIGVGFYVALNIWKRTREGKYRYDGMLLHMPIFGPLLRKVVLSRFARVFSNLIASGVSVVEAIRIVANAVGNEVYHQRLLLLRNDVKNGMKMAESLEDDPLFPDLLISMLRVGEETAQIGETIIKIADFYDEEVDIAIGGIQKMIEPIILSIMAVVIGFIAVGIMQPIMNLAGAISGG